MRALLDTHVFVWSVMDHPSLDANARALITSADEIYVSAASLWEIAIKSGLGKIEANADSRYRGKWIYCLADHATTRRTGREIACG